MMEEEEEGVGDNNRDGSGRSRALPGGDTRSGPPMAASSEEGGGGSGEWFFGIPLIAAPRNLSSVQAACASRLYKGRSEQQG